MGLDGIKSQNQSGIPQGSTHGPLLFLIYINDLPNSSEKLSFKIFADDTNVFASARDLEHVMNSELAKVKRWCDINKLSINMTKATGAPNENIVQNHLNIVLLNVF